MLNLTRRSFLQVAAAASALAAVAPQATVALAEQDVPAHAAEVKRMLQFFRSPSGPYPERRGHSADVEYTLPELEMVFRNPDR